MKVTIDVTSGRGQNDQIQYSSYVIETFAVTTIFIPQNKK